MKHGHKFSITTPAVIALALALATPWGPASMAVDGIIYVDADAGGENNGSSWDDAFTNLQPAMEVAGAGDQIWLVAGTYKPTAQHGGELLTASAASSIGTYFCTRSDQGVPVISRTRTTGSARP